MKKFPRLFCSILTLIVALLAIWFAPSFLGLEDVIFASETNPVADADADPSTSPDADTSDSDNTATGTEGNLENEVVITGTCTLRVIDTYWMEHINTMSHLREGIHLRGYANENPLRAYKSEGYEMFDDLLSRIDGQVATYLLKAQIRQNIERKKVAEGVANHDSNKVKKAQPKRVNKVGRNSDTCFFLWEVHNRLYTIVGVLDWIW